METKTDEQLSKEALDKYFEDSTTVTAQHVLFNDFKAMYGGMVNKFQLYLLFGNAWGNHTGKDTDGSLGYHKKVKPKGMSLGQSFTKDTPESSNVQSIAYDADTLVFSLTFKKSLKTYEYEGVTHEDALKALNSPSYGKLPNVELKDYKGVEKIS